MGNTDQLVFHLGLAKQNGNSEDELIEAITPISPSTPAGPRPWPPWPSPSRSSDPTGPERTPPCKERHLRPRRLGGLVSSVAYEMRGGKAIYDGRTLTAVDPVRESAAA